MTRVEVRRRWEAIPLMEGDELARFYFQSERIVLVASQLPPGCRSSHDPGHEGAHEVVYCVSGEVVVELGRGEGEFVHLHAGDAALIREGVPHTVYNPGAQLAEMIWCAAPSLGRSMVYG